MKFTYYTIIGRDLNLLKGHVENVLEYAGFNKLTCEKEFLVIVYKNNTIPPETTDSILKYCESMNIKTHIYVEPNNNFLINLYNCWNLGYELSDDGYVFRGGSDQVFSKDSFIYLYEEAEKLRKNDVKCILQANTFENGERLRQMGSISRHFMKDFGNTFQEFKFNEFENFIVEINRNVTLSVLDITQSLNTWGKPTSFNSSLGHINRTDGCSWLMTKEDWIKFGPLPPIENGITGDVIIHDRMQRAGYLSYIIRDCITYHFVRGESHNITQ